MAKIPGPNGPIEYQRDELGYPSIRAQSLDQGIYALGFFHGWDRLTQVTITALAAEGALMSVLGNLPFARLIDSSSRLLGLTNDLDAQVARCDAESVALLTTYSQGFNAGARKRGVPWVLRLLGAKPFVASPAGILGIFRFATYFSLTSNQLCTELIVSELAARGAPRRLFDRLLGESARGLDLDSLKAVKIPDIYSFFSGFGSGQAGSNAFAVAKRRSSTGGALLMGEFHMEVGRFPPLLYAAHLELPGNEYLTGITIPGLVWFAAGRTRHVGWSYTFAHADNVDFLVERVKDGKYQAAGEYRPFKKRIERVKVKRKGSEDWVFWDNEYGTLLGDAEGEGDRLCVRVSGLKETYRAFSANRHLMEWRTVGEMLAAQREVRSVSLEAILADRDGRIASVVTGQIDQRPPEWTGAYPRKGWDLSERNPATLGEELRPVEMGTETLASANQGGQGPNVSKWCNFPEPLYRFERISELLAARPEHDLLSMLRISYDTFDTSARRLLRVWAPLLPDHELARRLPGWADEQTDKQLLRLFLKLHQELTFRVLEEDIESARARQLHEWTALAFFQPKLDSLLALEHPELLDENRLRTLLNEAFYAALATYEAHDVPVVLRFKHLVTQGKSPAWLGFDSSPVELPGTPVSPFQCRVSPVSGESLVFAPAFHLLCDMSQDYARYNLPGGASESRFGPGYGKGVTEWLEGTLLPLGPPGTSLTPLSQRATERE